MIRRLRRLWLCGALLPLLLTAGVLAQGAGETRVTGRVTHLTGGDVPPGLTVTLFVFTGMEATGRYTTTAAADGTFRFAPIQAPENATGFVRAVYQGVSYLSKPGIFSPDQPELSLPVAIAETTGDPAGVAVAELQITVARNGDRLQIVEEYRLENRGDRTYIGQPGADGIRITLPFTLPPDAGDLRFTSAAAEQRFHLQPGGFGDTEPLVPGPESAGVSYAYQVPYTSGWTFERAFPVPITEISLVLLDEELGVTGSEWVPGAPQSTEMGAAYPYQTGPLPAGAPLRLILEERPRPDARNPLHETGIGVLVMAAALLALYALWMPEPPPVAPAPVQSLVQALAVLDADFAAGKIPEALYHPRRRELKQELYDRLR